MPEPPLSFAFCNENKVLVQDGDLLCGPGATLLGLREAARRGGGDLIPRRLDEAAFEAALNARFRTGREGELEGDKLVFDVDATGPDTQRIRDLLEEETEAPVIELVNQMLRRTLRAGASDLHVEPHEGGLRARIRVDGTLQTVLDRADVPVARVVSRLKVMAGLDISETRLPQDGRIALRLGGRPIDVRVSTLPGNWGERVVLRVLDRSAGLRPLDQLGLSPDQVAQLARLGGLPNGIILTTGPTGSGKTTTLYSLLLLANREERNIVTVEDPIEYELPGISQSQINSEIGMTFAAGLRATLRQDPDVILVGEIRDGETARTAAQAALTGHLVFSTLHANGTMATVIRLRDLGLDDFLIASTLRAVIAQRLLRRLCPACKTRAPATAADRAAFAAQGLAAPETLYHPQGCPDCAGTGFSGRLGVFEVAEVDDRLREAIGAGAPEARLTEIAVPANGTLLARAFALAAEGLTTPAEIRRVLGETL